MSTPLVEEVKTELETLTPNEFASRRILEPVPYAFDGDLAALSDWKAELGAELEVDPRSMTIVGSAAIGVSLKPGKVLRPFGRGSDFDVAVVSHFHFETAWRTLRSLPASTVTPAPRMSPNISTVFFAALFMAAASSWVS